MDVIKYPADC